MFYIIDTIIQLNKLFELINTNKWNLFVEYISYNKLIHPKLNNISLIYLRPIEYHKGFIIGINHSESFNEIKLEEFNKLLNNTSNIKFCWDFKKSLYYNEYGDFNDLNFLNSCNNNINIENENMNVFNFFQTKDYKFPNKLIPISKHYEYQEVKFKKYVNNIIDYKIINESYYKELNNTSKIFYNLEKVGIPIDEDSETIKLIKDKDYHILNNRGYLNYYLYNKTSRPSCTLSNINIYSLSKSNNEREFITSSLNSNLIEIDYNGYHSRLVGRLISVELPKNDIYENYFKLQFPPEYTRKQLKIGTISQLYGYTNKKLIEKEIFWKKVTQLKNYLWNNYNIGNLKSKIFNKPLSKILTKVNSSGKLLSYYIQNYETEFNSRIINNINTYILENSLNSVLILYNFDSFLIEWSKDDSKFHFNNILKIIEDNDFYLNIKFGKNYKELNSI